MKKNIIKFLILMILFVICSISVASEVKIISSGNENNVFETTGTLRIEWKNGDDCDYLGLIKMYFIPDNPAAFGGKIAYVWTKDMSDAVLWKKAQKLGYEESEEEDKKAGEEVLKLAKKIFKDLKIENRKNEKKEIISEKIDEKIEKDIINILENANIMKKSQYYSKYSDIIIKENIEEILNILENIIYDNSMIYNRLYKIIVETRRRVKSNCNFEMTKDYLILNIWDEINI